MGRLLPMPQFPQACCLLAPCRRAFVCIRFPRRLWFVLRWIRLLVRLWVRLWVWLCLHWAKSLIRCLLLLSQHSHHCADTLLRCSSYHTPIMLRRSMLVVIVRTRIVAQRTANYNPPDSCPDRLQRRMCSDTSLLSPLRPTYSSMRCISDLPEISKDMIWSRACKPAAP